MSIIVLTAFVGFFFLGLEIASFVSVSTISHFKKISDTSFYVHMCCILSPKFCLVLPA